MNLKKNNRSTLFGTELWILFSAWCSLSGWALSAAGHLDRTGYAISFAIGGLLLALWLRGRLDAVVPRQACRWKRFSRRFRRPLPFLFLLITALLFVGGALYAPNNYDALTYRIPRVLHWLEKGGWYWMDAACMRMNTRAAGFEWLVAPLLVFTRTTRFIFLLNFLSFLLFPGLLFQFFRYIGVRRRVAWNWMWVIPTGYVYVLQAGSASNDAMAAVYFLAALCFAFRARKSQRLGDLFISMLSIALATGAKPSNLTLALPWLVAIWPSLGILWKQKSLVLPCAVLAGIASFLPIAVANYLHCGEWTGFSAEVEYNNLKPGHEAIVGNVIQLGAQNLTPPIFPGAREFESRSKALIPKALLDKLVKGLEGNFSWSLGELQIEENAALGFGVSMLLVIATVYGLAQRFSGKKRDQPSRFFQSRDKSFVVIAGWLAFLVLMDKSFISVLGRVSAAYYPILISPVLLFSSAESLVRKKIWTIGAVAVAGFTSVLVLVLTPARPLWPARTLLGLLEKKHGNSAALKRAETVYQYYAQRADCMAPIRRLIPPGSHTIGFISSGDDPATSLWQPFGNLRIHDITPSTNLNQLDFNYLVVNPKGFITRDWKMTFNEWLTATKSVVVASAEMRLKVTNGAETWYLVCLPPTK